MASFSSRFPAALGRTFLALLLLAGRILPAAAQAPGWQSARAVAAATASGTSGVSATAVDATGNVFIAGYFTNSVVLGGTLLTSIGMEDVFVAKFSPVSNQFEWAQRAGGSNEDRATALAVSGSSVYVAGQFRNAPATFGATTLSTAGDGDVFVAKLTDAGNTGSFVWAQAAGGSGEETASALAVSGSNVYVAGRFTSSMATFGATTLRAAAFSDDVFVAKLTDTGSTGSFEWSQRAGGSRTDIATALAVSGTSVYVAGYFDSPTATFGATTLTCAGFPGSGDVFVAKLTDAGSTSSFGWAQRAGGTGYDYASALAVSGSSVYVAGYFDSSTAAFGTTTLSSVQPGFSDVFVAKLTDAGGTGSFGWAQRAGGPDYEEVLALAVSGTSLYIAGRFGSTAAFGTTMLSNAGSDDVFVAKLTDAGSMGSFGWAQRAGGSDQDYAKALAVSGTSLYVVGSFKSPTADFGPTTLNNASAGSFLGFLATLTDATLMGNATTQALPPGQLFPNPARYTATLRLPAGAAPALLVLTDAQGRTVRHYPASAAREVVLDLRGLPAGLYLVRGAGPSQRLVVE